MEAQRSASHANALIHVGCARCATINRVDADRASDARCGRCHVPLFEGHPVELDEATFDAVVRQSDVPVVVDFWAPWCGPCRSMAPHFERAAAELEPDFRLAKVDTDAEPSLAQAFGIRSIPTLVVFRGGREVARRSGAMDSLSLARWARGAG